MYDYLIVGAGLYGATLAYLLNSAGKRVLVVEKKDVVGGTVYTEDVCGITVHKYGAHIFRTNDLQMWNFINQFGEFKNFINTPIAIHNGQAYNLPFNMNTFAKLWNITTPDEAIKVIQSQLVSLDRDPVNLEEFALATVGTDIYNIFIKHYTEKQWNKPCSKLPVDTMRRIPIRLTYNNNYYDAKYQGVPVDGYTSIIKRMLDGVDVRLNVDGTRFIKDNPSIAKRIIYTGRIDEFFGYTFGKLEYRSLRFEQVVYNTSDLQGVAVVNWSDADVPYTRTIEHSHFLNHVGDKTVVSYEYPVMCDDINEAYYPINTEENNVIYNAYLLNNTSNVLFCGRLGEYKYYDMTDTIQGAINKANILLNEEA